MNTMKVDQELSTENAFKFWAMGIVVLYSFLYILKDSKQVICMLVYFFSFVFIFFAWFPHAVQLFVEFFYKEINANCLAGEVWCRVNLDLKIFFF